MENQQLSPVDFPPLLIPTPRKQSAAISTSTVTQQRNTPGVGRSNAFEIFLEAESELDSNNPMDEDSPTKEPALPPPTDFQLPKFLEMVSKSSITTDQLLVSFIPEWIKQDSFCKLMDNIAALLVAESTLQAAKPPAHHRPNFTEFFTAKPPLWMDMFNPEEQHGSYFLTLPVALTFSPSGSLLGLHPPRFFTVPLGKRNILVQAIPPDSRKFLITCPELAIWRGFGAEISAGHPYVLVAAIEAHTEATLHRLVELGDLTSSCRHFTYLAMHYVNIQEASAPQARTKTKGKGPEPKTAPARHSWLECFAVTVCDIPVGREPVLFQALLPPEAPFQTKLHPISLYGWRGEIASNLTLFRTWTFTPDPSLLLPQPVTRFAAIRPGHGLTSLCETLQQDFQSWDGIFFCFIQRGTTDILTLATDGRQLLSTPSLRALSYGGSHPDIPGMGAQRDCYRFFNQIAGGSLASRHNTAAARPPLQATPASLRPTRGGPSYAMIAQRPDASTAPAVRTVVQQETRLILHELSASLAQEASTMVSNAVSPLQAELRQAKAEIAALKGELAQTTASSTKALHISQSTLSIVEQQTLAAQEQREKDLEFFSPR